ncbi:MAG: NADH-quinone oxidoreductase subunit J [Pseudomonadota bacterium]
MTDILFYIFAAWAAFAAVAAVSRARALMSALWLMICFLALAGLFTLLAAPLIAALWVLIYAGAVMVLILFVVMLIDPSTENTRPRLIRFGKILGAAAAIYLAIVMAIAVAAPPFAKAPATGDFYQSTLTLGLFVLRRYSVPFELAGVLLLTATVAAISMGKKDQNA